MSGRRSLTRLALRGSWREWRPIAASAVFVALAVAVGMSSLAFLPGANGPQMRFVVHGAGDATESGAPVIRTGPANHVEVVAFGDAYATTYDGSDVPAWQWTKSPGATSLTVPAGTRVATYREAPIRIFARGRAIDATAADFDSRDAERHIGIAVSGGRGPRTTGEIALSRSVASTLGVHPGDTVRIVSGPGAGSPARVTGTAVPRANDVSQTVVLLPPAALADVAHARVFEAVAPELTVNGAGSNGASPVGEPAGGSLDSSYVGVSTSGGILAGVMFVGFYETLALLLPYLLMTAILAAGMHRRARDLRLLALAGAGQGALTYTAVIRGAIVATLAAPIAVLFTLALARLTDSEAALNPVNVLLPLVPAFVAAIAASLRAAQVAQRMGHGRLDPVGALRRSARDGGIASALAVGLPTLGHDGYAMVGGILCAMAAVIFLAPLAVWLPGRLPLPGPARAATRSVGRARWVSAPATAGIALATLVGALFLVTSGGSPSDSSNPRIGIPRRDMVAVAPALIATPDGTAVAPADVVRRLLPNAVAAVRIWPIDGTSMSDISVSGGAGWAMAPADADAVGIGAARLGTITTPTDISTPGSHWPTTIPHVFGTSTLPPPSAVAWLVRLPHGLSTDGARKLGRRTRDAGLTLVTADGNVTQSDAASAGARLALAGITALLALVFGSAATVVVLAERREEARRLLLAGARPRDYRLAAAVVAFSLGAAAVLLAAGLVVLIAVVTAVGGHSGTAVVRALAVPFGGLATVPFVLAAGAGLLSRPPRSLGRAGRAVRDASASLT